MPSESYDWNDEAVSSLRCLWSEGHSTAEIGRRLGVSKSAIVGKVHRLDLPARASPIRQARQTGARLAQPRAPVPKRTGIMPILLHALPSGAPEAVTRPEAPPAPPAPARRSSGRSCCWPIGHPGTPDFRFCGNPAAAPKPYCAEHASIAYRPLVPQDAARPAGAPAD